ncbi:hypothetical protein AN958_02671 [Leucoagaricus sp. SymC.cos]|nr:hypothetical protein AN958_02671 [Leucoagaricus sp. SymC.cos]
MKIINCSRLPSGTRNERLHAEVRGEPRPVQTIFWQEGGRDQEQNRTKTIFGTMLYTFLIRNPASHPFADI